MIRAYKILSYIHKNQAFSEWCVKALKNINFCFSIIPINPIHKRGVTYEFNYTT